MATPRMKDDWVVELRMARLVIIIIWKKWKKVQPFMKNEMLAEKS